ASQRICSSSSSRLIAGRLTFFTITECPDTAAATFLVLILPLSIASRIASVIALAFRKAPWTMASAGTLAPPRCVSSNPPERPFFDSSTALIDDDPTSRPTAERELKRGRLNLTIGSPRKRGPLGATLGGRQQRGSDRRVGPGAEHLVLVADAQAERDQHFALGVQAARPARFDAVDRQRGKARLAGQLRLAHHQSFAESLNVVARQLRFPPASPASASSAGDGTRPGPADDFAR